MKTCTNCTAGMYQDEKGSASCLKCPLGKYGVEGQEDCEECPRGFFREDTDENTTSCKSCPIGWIQDKAKSGQCRKCESGKFANESMAKSPCSLCPKGFQSNENGENSTRSLCLECKAGKYSIAGSAECDQCDIGKFQNRSASGFCHECPTGFYQDSKGGTECISCKPGEEDKGNKKSCDKCSLGMYGNYKTNLTHETNLTHHIYECASCETGKYQDGKGEITCKDCPPDTYNSETASSSNAACVRYNCFMFL